MTRPFAVLTCSLLSIALLSACQPDPDPGTTPDETETGDGDGDPGDGDGDGAPGDGDGDGAPQPDTDEDGVDDEADNCPEIANPNQRDFDGDGVGNVCDVEVFASISGAFQSVLFSDAKEVGDCTLDVTLEVVAGEVRIQLDDDAAVAAVEIVSLEFADVPAQTCTNIPVLTPDIAILAASMANDGGPFPVAVPHSPEAHDAGEIIGEADGAHPILTSLTMQAAPNQGEVVETPTMVAGELPSFSADITDAGANAALIWEAEDHVLATGDYSIEGQVAADISFELRGVVGKLDLQP